MAENIKPKVVVMCGSSRFIDIMAACEWIIERDELAITMGLNLLPWWYGAPEHHLAEDEGCADAMDELHLRKIDLADEIFIVNHEYYIGSSTRNEILYAEAHDIPVRFLMTEYAIRNEVYERQLVGIQKARAEQEKSDG